MTDQTRITYIISNVDKVLAFEWLADCLDQIHFNIEFVLIGQNQSNLALQLRSKNIVVIEFLYQSKLGLFRNFLRILRLMATKKPDVVHTHLFEANILGLTAAWLLRIKKRIYTRHHALIHYNDYPEGLKWDKFSNFLATDIIAVSKNVENILLRKDRADPRKIQLIHHGFDLIKFRTIEKERISTLRKKYSLGTDSGPMIGVIARYVEWKGIQYIIPAFKELLIQHPKAVLILANAQGSFQAQIKVLLENIPEDNYREILFENDLPALYKLFDVYVHTPIDTHSEAFGQTYVEALASAIPSIFTISGIAKEFIVHEKNALVVPFQNTAEVYCSIMRILHDDKIRKQLQENGLKSVAERFGIRKMTTSLESLYLAQ